MTANDSLTIILTDRAPVRIRPVEWPVISSEVAGSYHPASQAEHEERVDREGVDVCHVSVWQHSDSRDEGNGDGGGHE